MCVCVCVCVHIYIHIHILYNAGGIIGVHVQGRQRWTMEGQHYQDRRLGSFRNTLLTLLNILYLLDLTLLT